MKQTEEKQTEVKQTEVKRAGVKQTEVKQTEVKQTEVKQTAGREREEEGGRTQKRKNHTMVGKKNRVALSGLEPSAIDGECLVYGV